MTTVDDFDVFTDVEHIRKKPGMYIGSVENCRETRWVIQTDTSDGQTIQEAVQIDVDSNPALENCVLELLINAADHAQRCRTKIEQGENIEKVTKIKINLEKDHIVVFNNGQGIPLDIHPKSKLHIPETIFGNLRTSSNYDETKKRIVGGTNGLGAKAANIFSNRFIVETQTSGKKYYQEFSNGMEKKTVPKITKATTKGDYTQITYYPDFAAFSMTDFETNKNGTKSDIMKLIEKRVYDLSAAVNKETVVWYTENGVETKIGIRDFSDYMTLYVGKESKKVVYKTERWEVGFALCPYDQATQISFVNAICTDEGGPHVTHVLEPIMGTLAKELIKGMYKKAEIEKMPKDEYTKQIGRLKKLIKDNVIIFIKALIENPVFDSQLKRKLKTTIGDFGSRCDVPDDIIKKIAKLGVTANVLEVAKAKDLKDKMKKNDAKNIRLSDIEKLEDANWAGTSRSMECTLILVEGDSAKGLATNGITAAGGSNKWGIYPLKGKPLNIRTATISQLTTNKEMLAIKRIMGLKEGLTDITKLRYGRVMSMNDQDADGFHIKGLLINYFTFNWPELVEQGLLQCMMTPIVKIFKGEKTLKQFYNLDDYHKWSETNTNKYRIKYYKGLATNCADEAKEYFKDIENNRIKYQFKSVRDMPIIERTFDGELSDERKTWITEALKNRKPIDYNIKTVQVDYFINREFVQFSIYDNIRSIPNIIDGMKPSQRKVLFGCLKKKLFLNAENKGEIKVSQLAGYISENAEYHHGEKSLEGTIVGMAQEFVGTGNMNVLLPRGDFGTRLNGAAGAARYIFTALKPIVKTLFNETDNKLLKYIEEEGYRIEPEFYVPIVPMILLNGSSGIGTGWSTNIPCFKLEDVINNIKLLLENEDAEIKEMNPYYKGFKGTIIKKGTNKWISVGKIEYIDKNTIEIIELPVGIWKDDFKQKLNELLDANLIKSMIINDADEKKNANDICYRIKLNEPIEKTDLPDLIKFFKLEKNINGTNMVAFDENKVIQTYDSAEDILWTFYKYRLNFYEKRYNYLKKTIEIRIHMISEKLRFVLLVINDKIVVFKKKKAEIIEELIKNGFKELDESNEEEDDKEHKDSNERKNGGHDYLLSMTLYKFTQEEVDALKKKLDDMKTELKILLSKTKKDLWIEDLDKLLATAH
jgi:DNA topoisomerase-2